MADSVTLPLGFDVPDGWTPVPPIAPGLVFVAVHPESAAEFTPNLTLGLQQRADSLPLPEIADEAVERLGRTMARLEVLDRREVGTAAAPGCTQTLGLQTGEGQDLVQVQVFLTVPGPAGRVVLELVCTADPADARELVPDFRKFVASVHVRRETLQEKENDGD
ncbi:hypothetical protein [Amycolatopsis benzoatilytica]|uniref:hypothetical protein n=1 Tax=Amycolatopsis benzoatilytica TaxID=346045 RepID=UPI000379AC9D|nr:hypothetical protein [Amycolatopsis benzoatilytica]